LARAASGLKNAIGIQIGKGECKHGKIYPS
jgi:hypothetical protein